MRKTFKKTNIFKTRNKYESEIDSLIISREVSEKFDTILGSQAPECGGFMLGPKDADGRYIDEFIYDISASTSSNAYSPDIHVMTPKINNSLSRNRELIGMMHTHPKGCPMPSTADIEYAANIMDSYGLDSFIVGVGQVCRNNMVDMHFYKVYRR